MPTVSPTEEELIRGHLLKQYTRLGFTVPQAERMIEEGLDWHEAEKLVEQGCDPSLAFAILT